MKRILVLAFVACGSPAKPTVTAPIAPVVVVAPVPVASPISPDAAPLPLWPEVHKGTLPNGLTFYIYKHAKPEHRAFLWLAVNAGSVQEDDDQRGLAHFDEHMAFNGTERFPKNELVNYLESIGMRFGADLNAYTTWEQTVYQLEVPTDSGDFIAKGLDILRDWAGAVSYDPTEVEKERGVVLEEWRLGRGANKRLFDKHAKVLFAGTRYADRITIGDPEIIKHGKRDTLARFYKDWYRPDLMAVIAVGDFDVATMEKEIRTRFGGLAAPATKRERPRGGVPPATGTRVSIETDREATGTSLTIENLIAHRPETSKAEYRRSLAERLYSRILNERLATLARKPDAPFIGAFAGITSVVRDVDAFQRFAQAKGDKTEDALRALVTEVIRIERHGITATELERARTATARNYEQEATSESTIDSRDFTDEITRNFFTSELMIGRTAEKQLALELLPTITVDELNRDAKAFGGADDRVILISAPEGKPVPSKDRVLAIIDEVAKTEITPWEDKPIQQALMATPPKPGKIVKETTVPAVGVTVWTLSNGVRVIVKPTDFEADAVTIEGTSRGGLAMIKDKDFPNARFADDVAELGGAGDFDAETLGKLLVGKQVRVSTGIGETSESVTGGGSARDFETMMQLVYLKITAPRKDEQQFAVWKANSVEQLTNRLRSPDTVFARDSQAAEWKDNVRHKWPTPEEVGKVDQDQALAFYKARFGDAAGFQFVIVGAVELDKLRPLVETYLASLPAKGHVDKDKDLGIRKVPGVVKKEWKVGQEPKAAVRIDFHADESWTRDKERDMFIMGQVLSIRLRETLREDMGGVYGVRAGGSIARSPHQERSFSLAFGCDPTRVDELVKAAFDEIGKLAKDGTTVEYLDKVKATFLRSRETELRQNRFWAGWLSTSYRYGDDPAIVLDTAKMTARMTSDNVKAAAKRYLDGKQYYEAVMLPEK